MTAFLQDDREAVKEAARKAVIKSCHPEPSLHCAVHFATEVLITEWLSMARAGSPLGGTFYAVPPQGDPSRATPR